MKLSDSKKPRWKIIMELEENLKILKRGRRESRIIIISMLEETVDLIGKGDVPMLTSRSVRVRGKHKYATVHKVFNDLSEYSPQLLIPHNNFINGTLGVLSLSFYDVIKHDLVTWNTLAELGEVNESDRVSIQKLGELLGKFHKFISPSLKNC